MSPLVKHSLVFLMDMLQDKKKFPVILYSKVSMQELSLVTTVEQPSQKLTQRHRDHRLLKAKEEKNYFFKRLWTSLLYMNLPAHCQRFQSTKCSWIHMTLIYSLGISHWRMMSTELIYCCPFSITYTAENLRALDVGLRAADMRTALKSYIYWLTNCN
jgi:hypothetical protein